MNNSNFVRPWTEEVLPELPEKATDKQLQFYIACALRRQLEVILPEGTTMVDGKLVLPD